MSVKTYGKTSGLVYSGLIAASIVGKKLVCSTINPFMPVTVLIGFGLAAKDIHTIFFKEETLANINGILENL